MEDFYHMGIKEIFLPFGLKGQILDGNSQPKEKKNHELLKQQLFISLSSSTLLSFSNCSSDITVPHQASGYH